MTAAHTYQVVRSERVFTGRVLSLRSDLVLMPDGENSQRDVAELPGAVGIVALNENHEALLLRQYRHPVKRRLWEIPAGLLDSPSESDVTAGSRELLEEGGLRAATWSVLVDMLTSPGMSDETVRIFLAQNLSYVEPETRPNLIHEEMDLELRWVPLNDAVLMVLSGDIENGIAAAGLLAAAHVVYHGAPTRAEGATWLARKTDA